MPKQQTKACTRCHRNKIHCYGSTPCASCVRWQAPCGKELDPEAVERKAFYLPTIGAIRFSNTFQASYAVSPSGSQPQPSFPIPPTPPDIPNPASRQVNDARDFPVNSGQESSSDEAPNFRLSPHALGLPSDSGRESSSGQIAGPRLTYDAPEALNMLMLESRLDRMLRSWLASHARGLTSDSMLGSSSDQSRNFELLDDYMHESGLGQNPGLGLADDSIHESGSGQSTVLGLPNDSTQELGSGQNLGCGLLDDSTQEPDAGLNPGTRSLPHTLDLLEPTQGSNSDETPDTLDTSYSLIFPNDPVPKADPDETPSPLVTPHSFVFGY